MTHAKEIAQTKLDGYVERCESLDTQLQTMRSSTGVSSQVQLERLCTLTVETETLRKQLASSDATEQLQAANKKIKALEERLFKGEGERRKMHNIIQELKGNVRVAVRVRPLLAHDGDNASPAVSCGADGHHEVVLKHPSRSSSSSSSSSSQSSSKKPVMANTKMKFDKVFGPECGQDAVFQDACDLVQSALDGYNVCIFSYGQTGSGKTHTMQGSSSGASRGLIPRSVEKIRQRRPLAKADGWSFTITASFVEIYNETLNDLFCNSPQGDNKENGSSKVKIRNLHLLASKSMESRASLENFDQLEEMMGRAHKNRSVAATAMNAESSRSHCCFILDIEGVNRRRRAKINGSLNLVDLAGSERLARSQVESIAPQGDAAYQQEPQRTGRCL